MSIIAWKWEINYLSKWLSDNRLNANTCHDLPHSAKQIKFPWVLIWGNYVSGFKFLPRLQIALRRQYRPSQSCLFVSRILPPSNISGPALTLDLPHMHLDVWALKHWGPLMQFGSVSVIGNRLMSPNPVCEDKGKSSPVSIAWCSWVLHFLFLAFSALLVGKMHDGSFFFLWLVSDMSDLSYYSSDDRSGELAAERQWIQH